MKNYTTVQLRILQNVFNGIEYDTFNETNASKKLDLQHVLHLQNVERAVRIKFMVKHNAIPFNTYQVLI